MAAAALAWSGIEAQRDEQFRRLADQAVFSVENRLEAYVALLRGAAGLYAGSREVSTDEFDRYVSRVALTERYPGVQGLGFSLALDPGEGASAARRLPAGAKLWPDAAGARSAIMVLQPLDRRNRVALGFDMYSEPTRREAMARARDGGTAAASGPVTLVQEVDEAKQPGFLIYLPVYRTVRAPASVEERRSAFVGWVYSPFRAHDFFQQTLSRSAVLDQVEVAVRDGDVLLFATAPDAAGGRRLKREVSVAGRTWTVTVRPDPAFGQGDAALPTAVFLGGLIATAALTLLAWSQRERLKQAQAATVQAEETLRRTELMLAEVNHRVANSLQMVAGMVSLQAEQSPPSAKAALDDTRARVLAIARVHHRLYTSGSVERVDLRAYLENLVAELGQSLDDAGRRLAFEGVEATVPTDKAVSVGVAVAELVTNAAKYAYPDDRPGAIRVRLSRPEADRLELAVEDEGVGYAPTGGKARGTGLGMRIVRAMAANLDAEVAVAPREPGTRVSLAFAA